MERNSTPTAERDQPALTVGTDWSTGPRTTAWDRLWRELLRGLGTQPVANTGDQLGREGDDG